MGVEVDLYVECGQKASPSRTQYRSLIEDLLRDGWVLPPFRILEGRTDSDWSAAGILNTPDAAPKKMRVLFEGRDPAKVLEAWDRLPFGRQNLFVAFSAFRPDHPDLRAFFDRHGFSNGEVVLAALAKRTRIAIFDEEEGGLAKIDLQHYLSVSGKGGPSTLRGSALARLLEKHLGRGLVEACEYS